MESCQQSSTRERHLYQQVAGRLAHLIDRGTFRPGARVPSVRRLSRQWQVSVSTVLEAYRLLEDQGRIEARPQSGYYVRAPLPEPIAGPELSAPPSAPTEVTTGELVARIMRDSRDPNLVPLAAAVPNPALLPAEKLNRVLAAAARRESLQSVRYDPPPGCEALRVQVARRALHAGCALAPDEIVTTSGCMEALLVCLRATCRAGDTVAIESPTYFGILQSMEMLGLQALEIPTHPRDGISIEALRYALETTPVRACLVVPNFNNPLGSCMSDARKRELVELLGERGIPLIEDDIYGDLCFGVERPKVLKAFDTRGLVLLCSSVTKTLAPGYRVGWVAPGRYRAEVERIKFVTNVATASLPQIAVADFLANGGYDHHLRRIRRVYERQVAQMAQAVLRYFPEGTRVTHPAGGFVLWVELPGERDALELYCRALQSGITLAPGPMFSARQKYRHAFRITAAHWSDRIEAAIATLGRLAAALEPQEGG